MKFSRSTCEKYSIRLDNMEGWGIIFLDDVTVSIHSDFGNWSYSWTNHGCKSLKHFLVRSGRDKDYIGKKFCNGENESDYKDSVKRIKQDIIHSRKDDYITQEEARDAWDHLKDDDLDLCVTNDDLFYSTLFRENVFYKIYDGCNVPITKNLSSQFEMFYDRIWTVFLEELKKELDKPEVL